MEKTMENLGPFKVRIGIDKGEAGPGYWRIKRERIQKLTCKPDFTGVVQSGWSLQPTKKGPDC